MQKHMKIKYFTSRHNIRRLKERMVIRMKNAKRILCLLCAVSLAGALTAGCAGKEPAQSGKDATQESGDLPQTQDGTGSDTTTLQTQDGAEKDAAEGNDSGMPSDAMEGGTDNHAPGGASDDAEGSTDADSGAFNGTASKLGSLVEFSADRLDGGTFTQDDIQSKDVTVINFWSLTCGPCITEMPELAEFEKALPDNVQVVTVCFDAAWAQDETRELLEECSFEGVTLIAFAGDLFDVCTNIQYTPTTVFVDSEGNLVGDSIIGTQENLSEMYLEAINTVLRAGGKAEISLEE